MTSYNRNFPRRGALYASISMISLMFAAGAALAQTADVGSIDVQAGRALPPLSSPAAVGSQAPAESAPALAPAQASLDSIEPASVVSDKVLRDVIQPTSDYNEALKLTPGWSSSNPNGLLGDSKGGWRGFVDGQYNITFDGIPFGDENDPSHHSAAYFPAAFLGQVVADRGPGPASQVGYATFGGTLGLHSIDLSDTFGGSVEQSFGSFRTQGSVVTLQTGKVDGSDFRALFQYNYAYTGGAQEDGKVNQNQFLGKAQDKLGDFTITVLSAYGTENYDNIGGITYQQLQAYGKRYGGVNNNPLSQEFVGYNNSEKQTDMEYVDLDGTLQGWHVDNKLYTYAYTYPTLQNNGINQTGVGNATTANGGSSTKFAMYGIPSTAVLGYLKYNDYRAFGDIFSVDHYIDAGIASGLIRAGVWWEHGDNQRLQEYIDYSSGETFPSYGVPTNKAYKLNLSSHINTVQPYIEYEWSPIDRLTITPGFKYETFTRDQDALVNQTTLTPLLYAHTYDSSQPYLAVNYKLTNEISVYAQASQGYLVPAVEAYYVPSPQLDSIKPQSTDNYQAGVVFKNESFTADADVYRVVATNYAVVDPVTDTYTNNGTAQFQGAEAEGTYAFGGGWSAFASAALIEAKYLAGLNSLNQNNAGKRVGDAPSYTADFGAVFDNGKFFGSLSQKFVGDFYGSAGQFGSTSTVNGELNHLKGYNTTDLVVGIRGKDVESVPWLQHFTFKGGIYNIFNHQTVTEIAGTPSTLTAANPSNGLTYSFLPGQTIFGSVTIGF
jgi:iron complex outermembrane recepter protein